MSSSTPSRRRNPSSFRRWMTTVGSPVRRSTPEEARPEVTSETCGPSPASGRMSRQATRDTAPEMRLRTQLHSLGLRYRVHVRPLPELRRTADIVFPRVRVAVFVDGCFWHSCPAHATAPSANGEWWAAKLTKNVERDLDTDRKLTAAGWLVVRVWEHEDPTEASGRVVEAIRGRRPAARVPRMGSPPIDARSSPTYRRRDEAVDDDQLLR